MHTSTCTCVDGFILYRALAHCLLWHAVGRSPLRPSCLRRILRVPATYKPFDCGRQKVSSCSSLESIVLPGMMSFSRSLRISIGVQARWKHSSTQVDRLFKKNPVRARVEARMGLDRTQKPLQPRQFPSIFDVKFLPNGWSATPAASDVPEYPFRISRTSNKPNDGTGFLPVYAKFRYVT
jgi:hypothetical protein